MAPVEGIEPPSTVLETAVMPLYHTGIVMVGKIRFELIHPEERDLQSPATLQLRRLPIDPDFSSYTKDSIPGSARLTLSLSGPRCLGVVDINLLLSR